MGGRTFWCMWMHVLFSCNFYVVSINSCVVSLTAKQEDDPAEMKQYVLTKLKKLPAEVIDVVERTHLATIFSHPLKLRFPQKLLWENNCKGAVCLAGDAFHPMTPDLAQGACSALEDSVILARHIGEALLRKSKEEEDYNNRIKRGLEKYANDRRWRGSQLIATAYMVGFIQQSAGVVMNFLRDECLSGYLAKMFLKKADFDCGKLDSP